MESAAATANRATVSVAAHHFARRLHCHQHHVVDGATEIRVTMNDVESCRQNDRHGPLTDLAVIKVSGLTSRTSHGATRQASSWPDLARLRKPVRLRFTVTRGM